MGEVGAELSAKPGVAEARRDPLSAPAPGSTLFQETSISLCMPSGREKPSSGEKPQFGGQAGSRSGPSEGPGRERALLSLGVLAILGRPARGGGGGGPSYGHLIPRNSPTTLSSS